MQLCLASVHLRGTGSPAILREDLKRRGDDGFGRLASGGAAKLTSESGKPRWVLTGCKPGKDGSGSRSCEEQAGGRASARVWGDFKEKRVCFFSLDLFLLSLSLSLSLKRCWWCFQQKDICKKVKILEKEKQDQGTVPRSRRLQSKPHREGFSLSRPLG